MTNPLKLFVNFTITISHLKMAGYEFLRTSMGGVMQQDSEQFQYNMKKIHQTMVFWFVRDTKRRKKDVLLQFIT